ncbi:hypothetical protein FEE96_21555 [Parasedimentitalea maritima]|uniref:Uncharacterized protein n=1 Tax=Parasedimentitalea maritima TaxID=2578117 RepID=A0A5R8YSX2_9RHOB|nr:hypothetical protein [Zongyanglinia marina]KAE9631592.1 hypothetical protein GP644_04545 [Zongyanglinia marina]TLP56551.1 hypothetical protein FEE96_21555 [Zongyanglinia marina]
MPKSEIEKMRAEAEKLTDQAAKKHTEAEKIFDQANAELAALEAKKDDMIFTKYKKALVAIRAKYKKVEKLRSNADSLANSAAVKVGKMFKAMDKV